MKKRIAQATVVIMMAALIICLEVISHPWRYLHISYHLNNLHHYATQEEFLKKMEVLDEEYSTDIFSRNSDIMLSISKACGYNEYMIPALMCIETNGGNNMHGNFNYWNLSWYVVQDQGERITLEPGNFETEEEAFNTLSAALSGDRLRVRGRSTYESFSIRCCHNVQVHDSLSPTDPNSYDVMLYKMVQHIKDL